MLHRPQMLFLDEPTVGLAPNLVEQVYEILLTRLKPEEFERSILVTLGLSIILIHVMQYLFTATPRMVDTQYGFNGVEIGSIRITWTRALGAAMALASFGGLYTVLRFKIGRAHV